MEILDIKLRKNSNGTYDFAVYVDVPLSEALPKRDIRIKTENGDFVYGVNDFIYRIGFDCSDKSKNPDRGRGIWSSNSESAKEYAKLDILEGLIYPSEGLGAFGCHFSTDFVKKNLPEGYELGTYWGHLAILKK